MTIQSRAAAVQAEIDRHVAELRAAGRLREPEPHEPPGLPEPRAPGETVSPVVIDKKIKSIE